MIKKTEVDLALKKWAEGIVYLGSIRDNMQLLKYEAEKFLSKVYCFEEAKEVLFKPTKACVVQFRLNSKAALSYFIGGDDDYPEDKGFALHPWKSISFENAAYIFEEKRAIVMGNYFFSDFNDVLVKAEYTFGFRLINGCLKMDVHHSSFPYQIN